MSGVLERVRERLRAAGARGLCVFDVDGTVLDNRPRQARIVRDFGAERGLPELLAARAEHWTTWNLRNAMRRMGIDEETIEAIYPDAHAYWKARFFTSEYCVEDRPVMGAAVFLQSVADTGASLAYATGRPEEMRGGTQRTFHRESFPLPGERVHLLMKPSLEMHDDAWKVEVQGRLRALGTVVAAFDNEPTHANGYREAFPHAIVVRVTTEHSGRPVELLPGIEEIPHF